MLYGIPNSLELKSVHTLCIDFVNFFTSGTQSELQINSKSIGSPVLPFHIRILWSPGLSASVACCGNTNPCTYLNTYTWSMSIQYTYIHTQVWYVHAHASGYRLVQYWSRVRVTCLKYLLSLLCNLLIGKHNLILCQQFRNRGKGACRYVLAKWPHTNQ